MSNSDVPGPYRQDPAGDYGSAESGIGAAAGYGRPDYRDDPWRTRRAPGRRRAGPDPRGPGRDGLDGWSSAREAPSPRPGPRSGSYPAGRGAGGVADDLRDRLGVGGPPGRRRSGYAAPRRGFRAAAGAPPAAGERYAGEDYGTAAGYGPASGGYRRRRADSGGYDRGGRGRGGPGGPGRGGPRGRRRSFGEWFKSGDWWRRWTWRKALGVAVAIALGVPVIGLVAFFVAYEHTSLPTDTTALATAAPSTVYFRNGHVLGQFSANGLNRQVLTAQQIPTVMDDAIIAAEDRQFYSEGGISVTGILRAAYEDIKGGNVEQGGSTLTEQFVKNYYSGFASADNTDKSANDKLRQALVAIKLAHSKSKSWILTQYLNTVYLGQSAYGVGAAAQVYFGKAPAKLTISQSAMLAALANLPGYFSTDPHDGAAYTDLVARWKYVLRNMVRDNAITPAQEAAQKFPVVHLRTSPALDGYKGYLMTMVRQELEGVYHFTDAQINKGGMKIHTTFRQQQMFQLYQAVSQARKAMAASGEPLPEYAHAGAVLEDPATGAIEAVYGGPGYGVKNCEKVFCQLNMAENPKQVGSSFKPYVLATAVSQGMNVQSSILNGYSPIWIPTSQTRAGRLETSSRTPKTGGYLPFNEPSENSGPLTVQRAAAISSDPGFMDLAHRAGVQNVLGMARALGVGRTPFVQGGANDMKALMDRFGVNSHASTAGSPAIALGEGDLTAVEQASMFATLANGGVYHSPHVISKIIRGDLAVPLKIQTRQVLTPAQAADVDFALSADNMPGGTAYPQAVWPGRTVIGKTGTTETAQDAWFIGAIPQQALAVTLFTNKQNSVSGPGEQTLDILPTLAGNSDGGFGGGWPAYIWQHFMTSTYGSLQAVPFATPNYVGFARWIQVDQADIVQQPKHQHHHHHNPFLPQPSASACTPDGFGPPCQPGGGGGGGGFSPPAPCVPSLTNPCPPGQQARRT